MSAEPPGLLSPSSEVRSGPRISCLNPHLRLLPRPFAARDLFSLQKEAPPHPVSISRNARHHAGKSVLASGGRWGAAGFTAAFPHPNLARSAFVGGAKRVKRLQVKPGLHPVSLSSRRSRSLPMRCFLLSLRRRPPPCPLPRWRAQCRRRTKLPAPTNPPPLQPGAIRQPRHASPCEEGFRDCPDARNLARCSPRGRPRLENCSGRSSGWWV